jgi:hypothetical protein
LKTLADTFRGFCLFDLFLFIKDPSRITIIFQNYISLLTQNYFTDDSKYDNLVNCFLPLISFSSVLLLVNESDLPPNLLSFLLDFTKKNWQSEQRINVINNSRFHESH